MGGTAVFVDIDPVRRGAEDDRVRPQLGKQGGRGGAGRAVGTVDRNAQAVQRGGDGAFQVLDVIAHGGGAVGDLAQCVAGGQPPPALADEAFDLVFQFVRQLEALAAEDLDAVEGVGVVAGRDHDARVRLVLHNEIRHGGGGNDPQVDHIRPHAAQAGRQRRAQHIAGNARVLAEHHKRAPPAAIGQHGGRRAAQVHCQLTGHILAGDAAHPVGTKKPAHLTASPQNPESALPQAPAP